MMTYVRELFVKAQTAAEDLTNANIRILTLEEQFSLGRKYYQGMKTAL